MTRGDIVGRRDTKEKTGAETRLQLNPGTGMVFGVVVFALIFSAVQLTTGDSSIWIWGIPTGIAAGFGVGVGASRRIGSKDKTPSPEDNKE